VKWVFPLHGKHAVFILSATCTVAAALVFLVDKHASQNIPFKTYRNSELGLEIEVPSNWSLNYDGSIKRLTLQSIPGERDMGGLSMPPEGSQDVAIRKENSPCNAMDIETNADFVDRGEFFQKTVCAGNFDISFILMKPDPNFAAHKLLLETMEKSFKTF
jgi:hypothetical protein